MFEILFLIAVSRKVRDMAIAKGYDGKGFRWKFVAVWIVAEIVGVIIGSMLFGQGLIAYAVGLVLAVMCAKAYFQHIENMPDADSIANKSI